MISQGNFFLKAPLLQDQIGGQKKHGKTSSFDESRGFPIAQPIVCARKERLSKPKQRHSFSRSLRCKDDSASSFSSLTSYMNNWASLLSFQST